MTKYEFDLQSAAELQGSFFGVLQKWQCATKPHSLRVRRVYLEGHPRSSQENTAADRPGRFEIPATYPATPIELELPQLDGKTPKMCSLASFDSVRLGEVVQFALG